MKIEETEEYARIAFVSAITGDSYFCYLDKVEDENYLITLVLTGFVIGYELYHKYDIDFNQIEFKDNNISNFLLSSIQSGEDGIYIDNNTYCNIDSIKDYIAEVIDNYAKEDISLKKIVEYLNESTNN